MNYFKERFGFEEIRLTKQERIELQRRLKLQDQKRIEFFAFVSLVVTMVFIVLDSIDLYGTNQFYYLVADLSLFIVSLIIVVSAVVKNTSASFSWIRQANIIVYPIVSIVWATFIATLDTTSMLNMFTFFIVFFLISFFLSPGKIVYASYFVSYLIVYSFLSLAMHTPVLSESLLLFLIGSFITIPFYSSFRSTRKNSIGALLKLNQMNQNLEHKVHLKMNELKIVNEDLYNEIGQRKIIETKLREALKKAEMSDQLKTEFLANISHEIRTPLNAIIGFTEMLTEDGVNATQKVEFQKLVSSNTMFLLSTIDDIFDASLVNTHQIVPINSPFIVNKFLDALFYECTGVFIKYHSSNLEFLQIKLDDEKRSIISDEFYLKKAMMRLIDNAYKFTPSGTVEVGAKAVDDKILFYVKDTGISICEEDKEKIFQPFVQGDGSYTRDYGGAGLGLSIVKGIVTELKCDFNMESKKGIGSTFTLTFDGSFNHD